MTPKRTFYTILGIIGLLVIGIAAGTYGLNNLLSAQSQKLSSAKGKLAEVTTDQQNLAKAKKALASNASLYQIVQTIVPQNIDEAETTGQLLKLAAENSISLSSITYPSSSLGSSSAGSGPAPAATSGNLGTSAANSSTAKLSQLTPVHAIPGVYELQVTIVGKTEATKQQTASGVPSSTFPQFIGFLQSLEQNRLTALVNSITIQPNATNPNFYSFNLTLATYVKPPAK